MTKVAKLLPLLLLVALSALVAAPVSAREQQATGNVTVKSEFADGTQFSGMWIALENATTGREITAGYTPITFNLKAGVIYAIYANDYGAITFKTWSGIASLNPQSLTEDPLYYGVASGVHGQLEAVYTT